MKKHTLLDIGLYVNIQFYTYIINHSRSVIKYVSEIYVVGFPC